MSPSSATNEYGYCSICGTLNNDLVGCSCPDRTLLARKPEITSGAKFDAGKLRYSLVPPVAIAGIAKVLTFGALKYAPNSWQTVPNAPERYLDALIRHLEAYRAGELLDPESRLPHLSHLLTNASFLLWFQSTHKD